MSETPRYPVPRPSPGDDDPRFSLGLLIHIAGVLESHGYPGADEMTGKDLVNLQQVLFRFIYKDAGRADVLADHPSRATAPTTNVEGSA